LQDINADKAAIVNIRVQDLRGESDFHRAEGVVERVLYIEVEDTVLVRGVVLYI